MRGDNERGEATKTELDRFTPTCVGTTPGFLVEIAHHQVHPHVRGDNYEFQLQRLQRLGSPPRAWGQLTPADLPEKVVRFTPTCVGTTRLREGLGPAGKVHPHVRGDNASVWTDGFFDPGSPPRAWGIRLSQFANFRRHTVHPHVRGEYVRDRRPGRAG